MSLLFIQVLTYLSTYLPTYLPIYLPIYYPSIYLRKQYVGRRCEHSNTARLPNPQNRSTDTCLTQKTGIRQLPA